MNQLVRSWNKSLNRDKYTGPDAVFIEDVKIETGDPEMAERKSPQTAPVNDNSAGDEPLKIQALLSKSQFNGVIRLIKRSGIDRSNNLRTATWTALKRLRTKRDKSKAVAGIPDGSDQGDVQTIIKWTQKIGPKDRVAIKQLVAIDATCCKRGE